MHETARRRLGRSFLGAVVLVAGLLPPAGVAAAEPSPATPELAIGAAVVGTIRDGLGPVANARVTLCDAGTVDACAESGYSTTASDGTYEIGALPDTSYFVRIEPAFTDTRHLTGWYADDPPANHAASQDLAGVVSVASDPVTVDVTLPRLATIAGTITTVGAVPVDGAQLRICANAFDCWSPLADAAGRFESEPLAPGDYTVEVWAPFDNPLAVLDGWYRAGVAGNYTDDATLASLISLTGGDVVADVRLPKGLQIGGRVTRAGGVGVAGASVSFCDASVLDGCQVVEFVEADATGAYRSPILAAGSYLVQVGAPDPNPDELLGGWYRSGVAGGYTAGQASATTIVLSTADATANVTLPRGLHISGRVTRAGGIAVPDAGVTICAAADRTLCDFVDSTTTDASGNYRSTILGPGSYLVEVRAPFPNPDDLLDGWYRGGVSGNYAARLADAGAITLTAADATANVTLPKGIRIVGTIRRAGGAPVEGASVAVCAVDTASFCDSVADSGYSGSDGSYRTGIVSPGASYQLRVREPADDTTGLIGGWYGAGGIVRTRLDASLVTMTTGDRRLDLVLPTGIRIGGRVAGPAIETGVAFASVRVCRVVVTGCQTEEWATADATGGFLAGPFFPGDFKVRFGAPFDDTTGLRSGWYRIGGVGGFTAQEEDASVLSLAGDATANVLLPAGYRISGTIRADDGTPLPGASVFLCARPGLGSCELAITASDGTYRSAPLDDGAYRIEVDPPSVARATLFGGYYDVSVPEGYTRLPERASRVVVGVGDVAGIDVTLARGLIIAGVVTATDGTTPVVDAYVAACPLVGWDCASSRTGTDGTFLLGPLSAGGWRVSVDAPTPNPAGVLGGWYAAGSGYAATSSAATTIALPDASLGTISVRLPRGVSIRGRVLAAAGGAAVEGASITACPTGAVSGTCGSGMTNAAGDFVTEALAPGDYTVAVRFSRWSPLRLLGGSYWTGATDGTNLSVTELASTTVHLGATDGTLATIRLPRGAVISGRVTASDGTTPLLDVAVTTCPVGGGPCDTAWTDEAGDFTTGTLRPNARYTLELSPDPDDPARVVGGWYAEGATGNVAALAASATGVLLGTVDRTVLTARLPRGSVISGRIRRADTGAGIGGAMVVVSTTDGSYLLSTFTDDRGDYTTGALRPGRYLVSADAGSPFAVGWYAPAAPGGSVADAAAATTVVVTGPVAPGIGIGLPLLPRYRVTGSIAGASGGVRGADVGLCSTTADACWWATAELDGTFATPAVADGTYRLRVAAPVGSGLGDGWYAAGAPGRLSDDGAAATTITIAGAAVTLAAITLPAAVAPAAPVVTLAPSDTSAGSGTTALLVAAARAGTMPIAWWESAPSASGPWEVYLSNGTTVLEVPVFSWSGPTWYRAVFAGPGGAVASAPARVELREPLLQAIAFSPPTAGKAGGTVVLTATATSGLTVTFAVPLSSAAVCSLAGTTLTLKAAGTCTVEARQPGDATWAGAQPVLGTIAVTLTKPTLTQRFGTGTATPTYTKLTVRKGTLIGDRVTANYRTLAGKSAALWVRTIGGTWKKLKVVTFDSLGRATYRFKVYATADYQWRFSATGIWAASLSAIQRVTVR